MTLSELDGVMQHVKLRECSDGGLGTPVLMDVTHCSAPCIDICCGPVVGAKQAVMQLLQPAGEDGVGGRGCSRQGDRGSSSSQHTRAALPHDPFADLGSIEVVQVSCAAAASRVHGLDARYCLQHCAFPQQLAECVENDAIANPEEEMKWSRDDALS